jgi:thymidine phosphorylase
VLFLAAVALLAATDQGAWSYAGVFGEQHAHLPTVSLVLVLAVAGFGALAGVVAGSLGTRRFGRTATAAACIIGEARELARIMVELGSDADLPTTALITRMDTPLGRTAGNALEVREAVEVLAGGGPGDVVELTLALAREMLAAAGIDDVDPAERLRDGSAMDRWRSMIAAQGGDPDAPLPTATHAETLYADADGVLAELDALAVGKAAWRLGAGREHQGQAVQPGAGVELHAVVGDTVRKGQPVATLHTDTPGRFPAALGALRGGLSVSETAPPPRPLIVERITP